MASFTFQLVIFFSFPYTEITTAWWVGLLRAGHVILGDLLAVLAPLIFRKTSLSLLQEHLSAAVGVVALPLSFAITPQIASPDLQDDCFTALRTLSKVPFVAKDLLKEAQTELRLSCRRDSIPSWKATLASFGPFSSALSTMIRVTSSKGRFAAAIQPEFVELVLPSLELALEIIQHDSDILATRFKDPNAHSEGLQSGRLRAIVSEIHQIHFDQRTKAVAAGTLHLYARPLIRFNAFLYNTQLFFQRWLTFIDALPAALGANPREDSLDHFQRSSSSSTR